MLVLTMTIQFDIMNNQSFNQFFTKHFLYLEYMNQNNANVSIWVRIRNLNDVLFIHQLSTN